MGDIAIHYNDVLLPFAAMSVSGHAVALPPGRWQAHHHTNHVCLLRTWQRPLP